MNKFTTILVLSILNLIWPLSILRANSSCCGGGNRNIDFGGNIQPFEVPAVDEIVAVDGFTLKVNRVKWSIAVPADPTWKSTTLIAAVFKDKNTTIRAVRLPPLSPQSSLRDLASANVPFSTMNVRVENIRTTFAVRGVKASYGGQPNFFNQNIQLIRYYFQEKSGRILCFEVSPIQKFANWSDANNLILNTLQYRSSV